MERHDQGRDAVRLHMVVAAVAMPLIRRGVREQVTLVVAVVLGRTKFQAEMALAVTAGLGLLFCATPLHTLSTLAQD